MSQSYLERELKFDVEPGFVVPALESLLPPDGHVELSSHHVRSEYFDTVDHALFRAQISLRRRTGAVDAGWQLKVPHPPFREEVRVDTTGEQVPEELSRLVLGISGGRELRHIATVITDRSATRLLDAQGRTLAEVDDDTVQASASTGSVAELTQWREIEVELGAGDLGLLKVLGKRLRRAGARPSDSPSKLARALPAAPDQSPSRSGKGTRQHRSSVGEVVGAYIAEQRRVILQGDVALRRDDESVIHQTRVATRRLRSTLRVFGSLYETDPATALDTELRWYAALLGDVRDRQVLRQRLDTQLDEIDEALVLGPVRTRIDTELQREQREAWLRLQHELSQDRYLAMLDAITRWVEQPPSTAAARRRAATLTKRVDAANRSVSRKLERANRSGDLQLLHSARKAAKRARYAAEAAEPVIGAAASRKQAARYQKLQDLLGEHQDSLISADSLRRLAATAGTTPGENGFTFGILYEREQAHAEAVRKRARRIARRYS